MDYKIKIKEDLDNILYELDEVLKGLESAKNWGIADLLGGKTIISLFKHSEIQKAERNFEKVLSDLEVLEKDLTNLNIPHNANLNTNMLNQFLDIFSDNIFSDLLTQSKISDSIKSIKSLKYDLENLYNEL